MRLHKLIAHAGIASRRAAETLIREGRVTVNGRVVREMGVVVDPLRDAVKCDGQLVRLPARRQYLVVYKPKEVVSTLSDPQGRKTVAQCLPPGLGRVYPIGRLDWDAEGVLLFTDDGALAHSLAHPRYGVERTYHVKVRGRPSVEVIGRMRKGVRLEDGPVLPENVKLLRGTGKNSWVTVTIREGRHHEIKRLFLAVGHPVQRIKRVSFAGVELGDLKPGECRPLTRFEVGRLSKTGKSRA